MGAAAYIGRVGSLAVALGVGTAVVTGHGVAAADDTGSGTSSASAGTSNVSDTSTTAGSDTAPARGAASAPEPTAGSAKDHDGDAVSTTPSVDQQAGSSTTSTTVVGGVVVRAQSTKGASTTPVKPHSPRTPRLPKSPDPKKKPKADDRSAVSSAPGRKSEPESEPESAGIAPATAGSNARNRTGGDTTASDATIPSVTVSSSTVANAAAPRVSVIDTPTPTPAEDTPRNPLAAITNVVSSVANFVLDPLIDSAPAAPTEPPLAWSLLAFARREFDHLAADLTGRTAAAPAPAAVATPVVQAAAQAAPAGNVPGFPLPGAQLSPSTQFVQWVTGNYQTGDPLIADTYNRFGITGTDVGVMWDNGMVDDPSTPYDEHQVLMAFGDTFSGPNMTGNWRFNVLLRSADHVLSDGMTIPDGEWFNGNMFGGTPLGNPTFARQIIHPDGLPAGITLIPTAGISVPTPGTQFGVTQYVNFMSVTKWGAAGTWTTNYSAIAYSTDNGENWTVAPTSVRYNQPWSGNKNFQQGAFVRPGDGYVYSYGTPNGRQGAAYVSRVLEKDILDASQYEYYGKGSATKAAGWFKNKPAAATPIFGQDKGACGAGKVGNQVSEMSVQYNQQLDKYVVLHGDQFNNIVMRTSDTPEGAWSSATVLMAQQSGGIYAPMMHPWSPSTMGTGSDLYWNLSLFSPYNVMLMKTDLTKV